MIVSTSYSTNASLTITVFIETMCSQKTRASCLVYAGKRVNRYFYNSSLSIISTHVLFYHSLLNNRYGSQFFNITQQIGIVSSEWVHFLKETILAIGLAFGLVVTHAKYFFASFSAKPVNSNVLHIFKMFHNLSIKVLFEWY